MAQAMWFAANSLLAQKQKRKLMIVLTDGDPDDWAATHEDPSEGYQAPIAYEGYTLVWADEFNGNTVNLKATTEFALVGTYVFRDLVDRAKNVTEMDPLGVQPNGPVVPHVLLHVRDGRRCSIDVGFIATAGGVMWAGECVRDHADTHYIETMNDECPISPGCSRSTS